MKMLMEIDPLPMTGSLVMMMVMISPSRREVSPIEQLRRSPRLVPPRFRLVAAEFRPVSLLMIFFRVKDFIYKKMGTGGPPGGPRGRGARPHPRGQGVGPLWYVFRSIILINSKSDFRGVSGILELCRIGFQYFLLFQPRIPGAGILPLHVKPCKIRENSHKYCDIMCNNSL